MKKNHSLALIIAYYFSKFDRIAYEKLGFESQAEAHNQIGKILGVKPNSVKNMRDEFDPIHDNPRVGWYQRPLRPSRTKIVEAFQKISEEELRDIVIEIINSFRLSKSSVFLTDLENLISEKGNHTFIVRGPTGRKAEEFFICQHREKGIPVDGELRDMRDQGCGYDFEIINFGKSFQIEVKGLDGASGGISFTSKEWDVASKCKNSYFLFVVRNVSRKPDAQIIQNPASILNPRKCIIKTVQVRWNLRNKDLVKAKE